jgi:transglutaminase-like putative cysteine protease/tetratricopeptide (TPR) repeat protein
VEQLGISEYGTPCLARRRLRLRLVLAASFSCIFAVATASPQTQPKNSPPATSPKVDSPSDSIPAGKPDYAGENFVVEDSSTNVTFSEDGTGQQEQALRVRVLSQAAVQQFGVLNFPYKSANERLDIVYIRVTKPNGVITETPSSNAQDIAAEVSRVAPTYSDSREKQIPVKGLGVGDVLEWRILSVRSKPEAPGEFWYSREFMQDGVVLQETLRITLPQAKYVAVKASSPNIVPEITEQNGLRTYTWKSSHLTPAKQEQDKARKPAPKKPLTVQLTSFRNWDEVGHWYGALQKPQIEITPAIRTKAAELVAGATTDDAKLAAIYRFVAIDFRYISVSFGQGRYQPHSAEEVLSNQYGDCKDKHTLFAALLKSVGIEAWPALIGAGIKLDPEVPSPAQFNHVITYVPNHGHPLWLDTTPEVAPFGMLQLILRDQSALVIPEGGATPVLMTTPAGLPFSSDEKVAVTSKLGSDGTLTGHFDLTARGDSELVFKTIFHQTPPANWLPIAQGISQALGYGGTVSNLDVDNPADTGIPFHYSYDYERKTYSDWANRRFTPPLPPMNLPHSGDEEMPDEPIYLGAAGQFFYSAKVELPEGYALEMPNDANATTDFAEYHSVYSVKDHVLTAERRVILKGSKVMSAQWPAYQSLVKTINEDQFQFLQLVHSEARSADRPVHNNPEAADLLLKAFQSLQSKDLNTARDALTQAERLNPEQANLWSTYAELYELQNRNDEAIAAVRKEIQLHPGNEAMYRYLAAMQRHHGHVDAAIETWRELLKMAPNDTDAAGQLGALLMAEKKFSEAVEPLQAALKTDPDNTRIGLRLAEALLRAGKKPEGEALILQMRPRLSDGRSMNLAAWALVDTDTNLPLAQQLAEKATSDLESHSQEFSLSSLSDDDLRRVDTLGAAWDTLGWVYFRSGDIARAEKFVNASWMLLQHAAAADHLGQIFEKEGKPAAAIHAYELALAVQHNLPETRDRLTKLQGEKAETQSTIGSKPAARKLLPMAPAEELGRLRSTALPELAEKQGNAEVFVLFSAAKVLDVQFISGDNTLKGATPAILQAHFTNVLFPDDGPERIVRRGILSCSPYTTPSCNLVLLLPANTTK